MVSAPEQEKPLVTDAPVVQAEVLIPNETEVTKDLAELEGYLEKIEHPAVGTVTDDTGVPVLTPANDDQITITLPLSEEQVEKGLHHKIMDSVKWLAEWCVLIIKKAHQAGVRVVYKK